MKINRLGAIDIGLNSVKLLISDVINVKGKIVYKQSVFIHVPLKLGEDIFKLGYISEIKKDKLADSIKTFISFIHIYDVEAWRICCSSSMKEAANIKQVIKQLSQKGNEISLLSPAEEAYLLLLNFDRNILENNKMYIVADVGGGGTEISILFKNEKPVSEFFKLGTIRTLDRAEEREEWNRLNQWIGEKRNSCRNVVLVGADGNITKLNSLFRKRGKIKKHDFSSLYCRLSSMNMESRLLDSELSINRAEVIIPAMKIYLHLMKLLKVMEIRIPIVGLSDGIVRSLYHNLYLSPTGDKS